MYVQTQVRLVLETFAQGSSRSRECLMVIEDNTAKCVVRIQNEHAGYKLLAERIRNAIQPASIHTIAHSSFEVAEGGDAREDDSKTRLFP